MNTYKLLTTLLNFFHKNVLNTSPKKNVDEKFKTVRLPVLVFLSNKRHRLLQHSFRLSWLYTYSF